MATSAHTGREPGLDPAVLDRAFLAAQTLGDEDLARELLVLFRDQARLHLAAVRTTDNTKQRRDAMHTLKGAARAIGAGRVAAAAEAAESALDEVQAGSMLPRILDALVEALEEVEVVIAVILAEPAGPAAP
ncbi:Hpt domain-containing protein [Chelatococcus sp. SYSU_G07232]|uniref:Hpt domain-containing protein n=1 Tax=Chelatococcus albus TaxID=3047466 RepID=A0ABT7AGK3_9HYPH|nr:Hpt domain-containing protein [Chelatococcus sp. SYSU_G07232]MDJ1158494.1 Hpt domain-containing protein [Chelatococcus sp. SYSU_G07232]